MKLLEKRLARSLRSVGNSMSEIAKRLKVSKGSVSLWVGDMHLTKEQKQLLSQKGIKKEVIERRRATRLTRENDRRQVITDAAKNEIVHLSDRELWLAGALLYWAEGGKKARSIVRFSNSDPHMIKFMMVFFRKICNVPEEKFRGYIHIHSHLDHRRAEKYWSSIARIPLKRFYKTYRKKK